MVEFLYCYQTDNPPYLKLFKKVQANKLSEADEILKKDGFDPIKLKLVVTTKKWSPKLNLENNDGK